MKQHIGPTLPGPQPREVTDNGPDERNRNDSFGRWMPSQEGTQVPSIPAQRTNGMEQAESETELITGADADLGSTVVLPYVPSVAAKRTRSLRAWMLTLPADFAALLVPLAWSQQFWKATVATAFVTIGIFAVGGLYRARRHLSVLDELPSLYLRMLTGTAAVAMVVAIRHDSIDNVDGFLRLAAISAAVLLPARVVSRMVVLMARRCRWVEHSAIIVGGGPVSVELARLLRRYPQYGLRFGGFVDVAATGHDRMESMPLVGRLDDLEHLVKLTECDVVIIADVDCPESRLLRAVLAPSLRDCDLWIVPRLREFPQGAGAPDHIGAIPVVRLRRPVLDGPKWAVKRTSDVLVASLALLVLSPIMLLCAGATYLDGGRNIMFRQQRIGRHGKPFDVLKFRSMGPADDIESQTNWNIGHDPRVGPIGRFMRRTSLDELPQLWNVLRGDMSIVGPRPERPYFVDRFSVDYPEYAMRHRVPVGLTGLAQVSGLRGDTPISDRARFDNYYIENWSLWLDVKVVLRTVSEVFRASGR